MTSQQGLRIYKIGDENMILIFAVDENWNIGYDGDMLVSISEDLKRFRKLTEGNIVIMGRKTFEAVPGQKALPNRINIVVTRNEDFRGEELYILNDLKNLDDLLKKLDPNRKMQVFVTGGESIVRQLLPRCNKAYITKILKAFEKADTSLPNLDRDPNWQKFKDSNKYRHEELEYKFVDYKRINS